MPHDPIKPDAPFYTEEELDALYERDPALALRISRRQFHLQRDLDALARGDPDAPMPDAGAIESALAEARAILRRDGGDLELAGVEGRTITVRLTGACAGCPRSALDLKNVVEAVLRKRFPQIGKVSSVR